MLFSVERKSNMPKPHMRWWHVIFNTRCTWLPGDKRGFHNRGHRIHSSGDYKNPPPENEHEGLRRYNQKRASKPVIIAPQFRHEIGRHVIEFLTAHGYRVLTVSVSDEHVHILV